MTSPMKIFLRAFGSRPAKRHSAKPLARFALGVTEREWRRLRAAVFERDKYTCVYCAAMPLCHKLQADHVKPRSRGGPSTIENLSTACGQCNRGKGARTPQEWRAAA